MIGFYDGGEDGEAVLRVQRSVEVISIDSRNFLYALLKFVREIHEDVDTHNFLAGLGGVDEVPKKDNLTMPGQPTSRDRARGFLKRHLLVVPVNSLYIIVQMKRYQQHFTREKC
jgi:hypothetical protein